MKPIESAQVDLARAMMTLMREFVEPNPEGDGQSPPLYENLAPDYVHELARGAALLIEATSKVVETDVAALQARIVTLETMNADLRVKNAELRREGPV